MPPCVLACLAPIFHASKKLLDFLYTDLLSFLQPNFTRALISNTEILGLKSDKLHDEALSLFNIAGSLAV